jgi:predicted DNA-binding transcriptional regulator YafY
VLVGGGRDQLGPIERLVRMLAVLETAGLVGAGQQQLLDVARYGGDQDDQRRALNRELKHLTEAGWDIRNVGDAGVDARYVLRARDTRLRVSLTREQQAELARAATLAGVKDFADLVGDASQVDAWAGGVSDPLVSTSEHPNLTLCIYAASHRCLLQFMYKKRLRLVHPRVVQPGPSGWYLAGCEDGQDVEKNFAVGRMRTLAIDRPGSATVTYDVRHTQLDPLTWLVDPPVEVVVETTADHVVHVASRLGAPTSRTDADDRVTLTIPVTHRAAFRHRLYELGTRVRVLAPDEVRAEIVRDLQAQAEVAS